MKYVIDISDYQGNIDFEEIVKAGVDGVIIKISEGMMYTKNLWHFVRQLRHMKL